MKFATVALTLGTAVFVPGLLAGQAPLAQQPTAASEITASGIAEIRLAPDRAVVSVTVESREKTATAAMATNTQSLTNIVTALKKLGLPATALTTADIAVDQYFAPRYDPREAPASDGFIVRTGIRAETDDISKVTALIDAALAAGATRISVQYSSSKMSDARRSALEAAFSAARADAAALARAAGGGLGRLLSAGPNGASPVLIRGVMGELNGRVTGAAITGGTAMSAPPPPPSVTSSVVVSARWEFVPGPGH